jgi:YesN/AraC family two-component response regulator
LTILIFGQPISGTYRFTDFSSRPIDVNTPGSITEFKDVPFNGRASLFWGAWYCDLHFFEPMKLLIKNMVSLRCKLIVRSELEKMHLHFAVVELGEVEILEELTSRQQQELKNSLLKFGLELMEDKKSMLIEKIKNIIVEMIHYSDEPPLLNFSAYLSEKLNYDYNYLSNLFSEVKGTTIEHFIIAHKIERAKELLVYNELTLTEIAAKLHYSNVAHLSNQFKKVTGLTPTFFRSMKHKRMIALENL